MAPMSPDDGQNVEKSRDSGACRRSIGLYVHLPFCATKCGYCDFYSLPTLPELIADLTRALDAELTARDPGRSIETVFIGGGTPTILPADALETVLTRVRRTAGDVGEFTCEANPSSTDELKLALLRRCGVSRISFGAQSFHHDDLEILQRIHDPAHIGESVRAARAAGFDNLNLDLIFGIPGQTPDRWRESLRRAIELEPDHLSCYSLMYEPGTLLTKQRQQGILSPCNEDHEIEMFEMTGDILAAVGYERYEISNFARPGRECRANIIYWENREYLGVGPSAVSYLDGVRRKNIADVRRYVERVGGATGEIVAESEQLSPHDRALETAMQMLRLSVGIDRGRFAAMTGFDADILLANRLTPFVELGLVEADEKGWRFTTPGLMVSNRVLAELAPEPPTHRDIPLAVL